MKLQNRQNGFTLVEMTIVMIISGLLLSALVTSYLRWNDILRSSQTKESISIISDALAAYAARNYRVPCPANPAGAGPEPFGSEIGGGASGGAIGSCNSGIAGESEGIIPFVTIGIDASYAKDGWGNYFTYQVSPAFTQDPEDNTILVHAKCRTTDWIEGATLVLGVLSGGRNIAPQKARFCCMQTVPATQTTIFSTPAPATDAPSLIFNPDDNDWYDTVDVIADPNFVDANNPIAEGGAQAFYDNVIYGGGAVSGHTDAAVYAVISHGRNEAGAFIGNGTANRYAGGGASELINADRNSQNIYGLPHDSSNDNTYYDDIVSWQTQSNLMSRLRRDSCAAP